MHRAFDSFCPSTTEEVLVSGANGVCDVPGWPPAHAAHATLAFEGILATSFMYALARRKGPSRSTMALLLCLAAVFSAPGMWQVLMDRPDAPTRAGHTAESIEALIDAIDTFSSARRGCLIDVRSECLACQPILRFVLPARPPCEPKEGRIELEPGSIEKGCAVGRDVLECGRGPI